MRFIDYRIQEISNSKRAQEYINQVVNLNRQLAHGDWKEHKYIAKVKIKGDHWRYFYDKEEYENFLKKSKEDDTILGLPVIDDIFSFFANAGRAITSFFSSAWNNLRITATNVASFLNDNIAKPVSSFSQESISNGQKFVSSLLGEQPREHKYVARITTASGEYRYFYSEEEYQRYLKRQEYQENEPDFMEEVPEYHDEMTMSENAEEVNPNFPYGEAFRMGNSSEDNMNSIYEEMSERGYNPYDLGDQQEFMREYYPYTVNCSLCTLTYELRERGYDVEAKPNGYVDDNSFWQDRINTNVDWISTVYENPKSRSYGDSHDQDPNVISSNKYDVLDDISQEPIGSRGELAVFWTNGGGHSVAYTVGANHEITVWDTQTNDTYSIQDVLELSDYIRYTRTDNLELSEECLQYVEYDN